MFTESELYNIVETKIRKDEKIGNQVSGSGHLGYVSYEIDSVSIPKKVQTDSGEGWRIEYTYTIFIETEFTYYPDNPPHERKCKGVVMLDNAGKILENSS